MFQRRAGAFFFFFFFLVFFYQPARRVGSSSHEHCQASKGLGKSAMMGDGGFRPLSNTLALS